MSTVQLPSGRQSVLRGSDWPARARSSPLAPGPAAARPGSRATTTRQGTATGPTLAEKRPEVAPGGRPAQAPPAIPPIRPIQPTPQGGGSTESNGGWIALSVTFGLFVLGLLYRNQISEWFTGLR